MTNIAAVDAYVASLRFLPGLLVHEGRLAEMEGRYAEAAQSYVDALGMGTGISRVGSIIHPEYVGFEAIGVTELTKLVPKLNPEKARLLIPQLEKVDGDRMTWDEVRRNESYFPRHELSKGFNPIILIITRWDDWRSIQRTEMFHKDAVARLRLLTAEVALRCYQSAQERVPARLADLVTNYLSTVPQDPFNNQPMIYRPQGTNWLLYSVGPDGVDGGGKPAGRGWPFKGDIQFDSSL